MSKTINEYKKERDQPTTSADEPNRSDHARLSWSSKQVLPGTCWNRDGSASRQKFGRLSGHARRPGTSRMGCFGMFLLEQRVPWDHHPLRAVACSPENPVSDPLVARF